MTLTAAGIEDTIRAEGFTPLGWIAVTQDDGVPAVAPGTPARRLLLIGNAGLAMWHRFSEERNCETPTMDAWSNRILDDIAGDLDAVAHYPFSLPHMPFQRWAMRSGAVHTSPLGMTIHREYGLWHAYRAAFAFAGEFDLAPLAEETSPCDNCAEKPCLGTCPVGAFSADGYDVPVCAAHLATPEGADCMEQGCRARRACPIGRDYVYEPAQALFHMSAFVLARSQND